MKYFVIRFVEIPLKGVKYGIAGQFCGFRCLLRHTMVYYEKGHYKF